MLNMVDSSLNVWTSVEGFLMKLNT